MLGSMPGVKSLQARQYYAHPRNAFWPVMAELLGFSVNLPYEQRCRCLLDAGVALWDVLQHCTRPGSLDSCIDNSSVVVNDFARLLAASPGIRVVFFNGAKAEEMWRRHVQPGLNTAVPCFRLPSTSPAHAALKFEQKLAQWHRLLDYL